MLFAEAALRGVLDSIQTAEELENVLKERYGVGSMSKKSRTIMGVVPSCQIPARKKSSDDGIPLPTTTAGSDSPADLAGLLYIGAGLKDPCQSSQPMLFEGQHLNQDREDTAAAVSNGAKSEPERRKSEGKTVHVGESPANETNSLQENSKALHNSSEGRAILETNDETKVENSHTKPLPPMQNTWDAILSSHMWRVPFGHFQGGDPPAVSTVSTLLPPVPPLNATAMLFPMAGDLRNVVSSFGNGTALELPALGITATGKGAGDDGQRMSKYHGDRPGRPPSYDDMVVWCVQLKRCLWRRHVPLTIEEAVAMVNDAYPLAKHPSIKTEGKGKSLVASTLRKRVLGIFKLTWSQVATDADPGSNDEIIDPSVLAAASIKLKRQGMDPLHTHCVNRNINLTMPKAAGQQLQAPPPLHSTAEAMHNVVEGNGRIHPPDLGGKNKGDLGPKPLDSRMLLSAPAHVHEIIKKGYSQNLTTDEAYDLLSNGKIYGLPLCSRPDHKPEAGSMYLFDRKFTPGFRCDGYDFVRRETHAKRKVGDEVKLNCYYAGGLEDPIQRRCYWLLDENVGEKRGVSEDLVLVHYLDPRGPGNPGRDGDDVHQQLNPQAPVHGAEINAQGVGQASAAERQAGHEGALDRFATANVSDPDSMFDAMCTLHNVSGISKQEQATICRLWMDNVLDDVQKKQLFMYIKANLKDQDAVADWVKGVITKNKNGISELS